MQSTVRVSALAVLVTTVLWSGCHHEEANTQRIRSLADIPAPNSELYKHVQEYTEWRNPYLTVLPDGIRIQSLPAAFQKKVPIGVLHQTLLSLPASAWPYGRVVAVQAGGGPQNNTTPALIEQNRIQVQAILRAAGVTIDYWPGA
jgi:hypothetical protein